MSDSHSSGGIGKMVVIAIFTIMIGVYAIDLLRGAKHPVDPSAIDSHAQGLQIEPKEAEKLKLERDQALSENELLRQELKTLQAKAQFNEIKLNNVKNLLKSEAAVTH